MCFFLIVFSFFIFRSFSLEVTVDNKKLKKKECFVYSVKCLPAEILTDQQTYYTVSTIAITTLVDGGGGGGEEKYVFILF